MARNTVSKARWFVIPVCVALLAACGTQMKVASVDEKTGLLKSERGDIAKATVVTAKKMPLAPFKGMAFMSSAGDWGVEQLKASVPGWTLRRRAWRAGGDKLELVNLYPTQHGRPARIWRFTPFTFWPLGWHEAVWVPERT